MGGRLSDLTAFLFTDVEGSTARWETLSAGMPEALEQHDALLGGAVRAHGGHVFKHLGDGMAVAFPSVDAAVVAAVAAQLALEGAEWPPGCDLRVRMGIHVGTPVERDGDYFGAVVNRAARVMAAGHGGQILVSGPAVAALAARDASWHLVDLGQHHLRDLAEPIALFQLRVDGLRDAFPALKTLDAWPSNLPRHLASIIGRDDLVAAISHDIAEQPLVTVVGPAGMGKTRLSQAVGAEVLQSFADGVWFVDLSAARTLDDVVSAIAAMLDLAVPSPARWLETFRGSFAHRRVLLILDNCEQVLDAASEVIVALLSIAPRGHFLATSREPLGVASEVVHRIAGLDAAAAAALFRERAATAGADVGAEDHVLHELCERLDRAPLAIELAAARARVLKPSEILARLEQRFRILSGSGRRADRHQTLRVAIDWSYELLAPMEQLLLDRLAVFAGGFDLGAAEQVCGDDLLDRDDVLDVLQRLVDKSFVVARGGDVRTRFGLFEMIADYAMARLDARDEVARMRDRHAQYFVEHGRQLSMRIQGSDLKAGAHDIWADIDNLRSALDWLGERGWHQEKAELVTGLTVFYATLAHGEGLRRHDELIAAGRELEPKLRIDVLVGAAHICVQSGNLRRANELLGQAQAISEEIGVSWPADLIFSLATIAEMDGRSADAIAHCETLLAMPESRADAFLDVLARVRMAGSLVMERPAEALDFAEETLRRAREAGVDLLVAAAMLVAGIAHLVVSGRQEDSEAAFRATIEICGDALPSASLPAHVGLAMLHAAKDPHVSLDLVDHALAIDDAGVDEPVSRSCCYDVAASACVTWDELDAASVLLRGARRLRETCGFGGYAWTFSARERAAAAVGTSAIEPATASADELTGSAARALLRDVCVCHASDDRAREES